MATIVQAQRSIGTTESARRIWAIVGAGLRQSRRVVRLLRLFVHRSIFRIGILSAGDRTTQLLTAAGIFGAGFLMRPIGSWFFGRIADKRGRRVSMMIALIAAISMPDTGIRAHHSG
jgi:MHS family alpha-ketoglutarate permease-like MFS transporter